jgi:hypothetical protein
VTRYLFYDFETRITKDLRLSKMTTRAYCDATEVTMLAWALDDEEIQYHVGQPGPELIERLRAYAEDPDIIWVAFNSSFDSRVLHYTLGLPYPKRMLCAMELSRAAWPNQPGGYSLDNLSATLGLQYRKLKVDLYTVQGQELADYCKADVAVLRELWGRIVKLVDPQELRVCEMSNRSKQLYFEVDQKQVLAAVENMANLAGENVLAVCAAFDDDPEILKAFGWHGDEAPTTLEDAKKMAPKSVKPHVIKELLLDRLAIDFTDKSISLKKINQAELAAMPAAGRATITSASETNKALSYGRGLRKFSGVTTVDCELSYAAAHTLRFASRNEGSKGLNLHNCPKHNPIIAMPFRKSFRLPEGYIWVRGDFANVEYRVEGLIAGSEYIRDLFTTDLFADPYVAFGEWSTGLTIDKNTPTGKALRQIFKAAVLGLGYLMGIKTWMTQLLQVIARGDVTIPDLIALADERKWRRMSSWARRQVTVLGCHEIVGIVGEHVHELFHRRHPEFARLGRWLEAAVSRLSYAHDPARALEALYDLPGAPDRRLLDLFVDRSLGGSSVRARYPQWPASVCWRDLAVRETRRGACLTSVLAGHKPPRPFTPNIAIENFVQHFSRNALVKGQLELEELGHEHQISIHDEAFILSQDTPEGIIKARTDMLKVFGPGNSLGYGWAINVDPASITVSKTLWDDEKWCQKQFWPRLLAGDESVIREVA